MKHLEVFDKNKLPIFEGDELLLDLKDKSLGGSQLGSLCRKYDVDSIKIKILENGLYIQNKYVVSFYKNGIQIITIKEYDFWDYLEDLQNGEKPLKTVDDFNNNEDANNFFESTKGDNLFFRYLVGKGVEKISGTTEAITELDISDLLVDTVCEEDIHLTDSVTFEMPDDLRKMLSTRLNEDVVIKQDYSNITFVFNKLGNNFDLDVRVYLTDSNGKCVVFSKKLNALGELKSRELGSEYRKERKVKLVTELEKEEGRKRIEILDQKDDDIYNTDEYFDLEDYSLILGLNEEVRFFNSMIKKGNKPKIL